MEKKKARNKLATSTINCNKEFSGTCTVDKQDQLSDVGLLKIVSPIGVQRAKIGGKLALNSK